MVTKKTANYKIIEIRILELISIALVGILLVGILYQKIGDNVIFISIAIVIIELIVFISNNTMDFFYKKLNREETK